jgi:hypothetical protein
MSAPILDQSFTYPLPSSGSGFGGSCFAPAGVCASLAQTFTAGISGFLTGVSIDVTVGFAIPNSPPTTGELYLSVFDTVGGEPGANPLTSATIAVNPALFPSFPITTVFTLPSISIVAGTQYALELSMTEEISLTWFGFQSFGGPTDYSGGAGFTRPLPTAAWTAFPFDADLHFQTFVDTVPEPSTLLLLVLGLASVGVRVRRNDRG